MDFELKVLGTSAAVPAYGRFPSAQLLSIENLSILIDCGEGTQMRFQDYHVKTGKLQYILISHLHGDHCFGLIGLLTSFNLTGRTQPLHVFSPPGLEGMIRAQLEPTGTDLRFPLTFQEINPARAERVLETSAITIDTLPLLHRVPCCGYRISEKPRPRTMNPEKIKAYALTIEQIKAAKVGLPVTMNSGKVLTADELTLPSPPPRSYAYCSDTAYNPDLVSLISGVDLLYHDSTFCNDNVTRASETGHSTAKQAAQIAKEGKVGHLVLGHFSSRYPDVQVFEEEAGQIFDSVTAATDGMVFNVPYPTRSV